MNEEQQSILIVDDEPNNLAILSNDLSSSCRVLVAKSGEQALKRAFENEVDLILLDVMMPGLDGYEVCRRLKEDEATRDIPVIFLTARGEVKDETFGLALGAVDYIKKPFSLPIVRARVKNHLKLKQTTDTLERLAAMDGLTGVSNRRRFEEFLDREWRRARRGRKYISAVMLDIDHFKLYNDHYGHVEGDRCLKDVARALDECVRRPGDLLARYGGEEFVAVMTETGPQGALCVTRNMLERVRARNIPHEASRTAPFVTVSIGCASLVPDESSGPPDTLVRKADEMLYQAKKSGRNQGFGCTENEFPPSRRD